MSSAVFLWWHIAWKENPVKLVIVILAALAIVSATQASHAASRLTEDQLKNMSIPAPGTPRENVKFVNGQASGPVDAGDPELKWHLSIEATVFNSKPGQGNPDAVIEVMGTNDSSSVWLYVCPVFNHHGRPQSGSCVLTGSTDIHSLKLVGKTLIVDDSEIGPGDPLCCGSYERRRIYAVRGHRLILISKRETGRRMQ